MLGNLPPTQPTAPLGGQTAATLTAMFQEAYRQEVAAEEDVHRTLPFFATALGFVIAAINYAAGQLPSRKTFLSGQPPAAGGSLNHHVVAHAWPALLASSCLVVAAGLGAGVLAFLALVTRRRRYQRIGPEPAHLARAATLQTYHRQAGLTGSGLDQAVLDDLRDQLLDDYARVIDHNRALTLRRYSYRARAVSCLLLSLLLALLATILALVLRKFDLLL